MSEPKQPADGPDILEQALAAVRAQPLPAGPPTEVLSSTAAAIQQRLPPRTAAQPSRRATRFLRYGSLAMAAGILVAVLVGLVGSSNGTARAFEQALATVRATEAVRYRVRTQSEFAHPQDGVTVRANYEDEVTIRGRRMRVELVAAPKLTWIIDAEISAMLILDPETKTYQTVDLAAKSGAMAPFDIRAASLRAQLEDLVKQHPLFETAETSDGVATDRYTLHSTEALGLNGDWTIWLDRSAKRPVRLVFKSTQAGKALTREYAQFDWQPTIGEQAFSFAPPDGYREATIIRTIPPLTPLPKKK